MRATARTTTILVIAAAGVAAGTSPVVRMSERTNLELAVQPLTASFADPDDRPGPLTLGLGETGDLRLELLWPTSESTASVRIRATAIDGEPPRLQLVAEGRLAGGQEFSARRAIAVPDRTTSVFEVYRARESVLTLAVQVSASSETVVASGRPVGQPVRLRLAIEESRGEQTRALESNVLHTFVGEPVTYSFRFGSGTDLHSVAVQMRPLRIVDDLVEFEIDLSGTLPGADAPEVLSHRQRLYSSRGAAAAFGFQAGDPPTGYRFLLTAEF